MKLNNIQT